MSLSILILFMIWSNVLLANSMAPIFPLISFSGWMALPAIIFIEYLYFWRKKVNRPFILALYGNLYSTLIGMLPAVLTFYIMLGPPLGPYGLEILLGSISSLSAIVFHWWFSSKLEHSFARKHRFWKNEDLKRSDFYIVNGVTYFCIFVYFFKGIAVNFLVYVSK